MLLYFIFFLPKVETVMQLESDLPVSTLTHKLFHLIFSSCLAEEGGAGNG